MWSKNEPWEISGNRNWMRWGKWFQALTKQPAFQLVNLMSFSCSCLVWPLSRVGHSWAEEGAEKSHSFLTPFISETPGSPGSPPPTPLGWLTAVPLLVPHREATILQANLHILLKFKACQKPTLFPHWAFRNKRAYSPVPLLEGPIKQNADINHFWMATPSRLASSDIFSHQQYPSLELKSGR